MLYRISLDLAFPTEDPLNDILEEVMRRFDQAVTINPGTPHQERGFVKTHECHHDEDPATPCPSTFEKYTPM